MGNVQLSHVSKRYGNVQVITDLSLEVEDGSFTALLGPSGCGKSTLLRMIAGLEEITAGQCFIDGAEVTDTAPAKRGVAMVFQSYALYPHMTVRNNIGFPLKMAGENKELIDKKVREA
ncbi:MAG TPA: ABC transporter ATP-binding protein, partial [Candidatus Saccharimonadales bacterium]|nr:ABC transporter ATP-binding protein [Candidatus Saccharimonadales bacterium]